ncbi:MAG TPA: hypothetical protein VGM62_10145 [Chthoniobacterales bacterium]
MHTVWQYLHYGARISIKQPGFSVIAIATLALSSGANTAIFSAINTLLLRPLPVDARSAMRLNPVEALRYE